MTIDPNVEGLIQLVRALEGRGVTGDCCCVRGACGSTGGNYDKGASHICKRAPLDRWWRRILLDESQLANVEGAA